jgi:hypothetical protein
MPVATRLTDPGLRPRTGLARLRSRASRLRRLLRNLFVLVPLLLAMRCGAPPRLEITGIPVYAADGFVTGRVWNVNPTLYHVALFIQIEGIGWYTKPTFLSPTVPIQSDGSFSADVVTGGVDDRATIYCAMLLPIAVLPPSAAGDPSLPEFANRAEDCEQRFGRTIEFAGGTFGVKESPVPVGPGPNHFSSHEGDVFVDTAGLHLTMGFRDGQWRSSEVVLLETLGHGTYCIQTDSRLDVLDANLVFGFFTWDPYGGDPKLPAAPNREIDVEDSRWRDPGETTTSQSVIQPWWVSGNLQRYTLPSLASDARLTRCFSWEPTRVEFVTLVGHHAADDLPEQDVVERFVYEEDGASHIVPSPGRAAIRLNLWLIGGSPPLGGTGAEVVISGFEFVPLPEPSSASLGAAALALLGLRARSAPRS